MPNRPWIRWLYVIVILPAVSGGTALGFWMADRGVSRFLSVLVVMSIAVLVVHLLDRSLTIRRNIVGSLLVLGDGPGGAKSDDETKGDDAG